MKQQPYGTLTTLKQMKQTSDFLVAVSASPVTAEKHGVGSHFVGDIEANSAHQPFEGRVLLEL